MSDASLPSILETARQVVFDPRGFYRTMPQTGGFATPVIFVLVMAVVSGIIIALLSLVGGGLNAGVAIGMGAVVLLPIMAIVGSFIGAAIMFVIWKLMGSPKDFETAYRCVAYAAAIMPLTTLLAFIPYIGSIAKVLWSFYLMYMASVEVHAVSVRVAAIVFGVLGVVILLINLSAERTMQQMQLQMEQMGGQLEGLGSQMEGVDKMTPEQAGKAVGEFLKGLEGAVDKQ